jgi:2-(1,2-epoxy-1,2-dihydrophenyl)acetyl-CoA isomerase
VAAGAEVSGEPVLLSVADGLATITLNRPDRHNTIDLATARRWHEVALEVAADSRVRAVLLTAAGPTFCAGGDLKSFAGEDGIGAHLREITSHLHAGCTLLHHLDAPVVVAVRGAAAGAGLGLACMGDVVLASDDATFVFAYTALGFTPDGGTSWWLPRLVGIRTALDLALTNRPLGAAEALARGLVTRVHPASELDAAALELAGALASGPTRAIGETRRLLADAGRRSLEEQLAAESLALSAAAEAADGREGLRAFVEKRKPKFGG